MFIFYHHTQFGELCHYNTYIAAVTNYVNKCIDLVAKSTELYELYVPKMLLKTLCGTFLKSSVHLEQFTSIENKVLYTYRKF